MLQLKNICKSYTTGDFTQVALNDVSISFRDNEFVAILGPSGSGKTTLLNVMGGLDHYDSGDMIVDGISTHRYKDRDWDTFRNNRIFDTQGHQGRANGYLHYRHFKDLEYRFRFDVDNMLVMNTKESPDFPFYGTVYGTGNATIAGNAADGGNIDVAMTTNRNTNFLLRSTPYG